MALVSKPGITGASAKLAVPKEWDQNWFKSFISNYLQGADVRNAVGANGVTVSGNIASPYAIIGLGTPIVIKNQAGTATVFEIFGDGHGFLGPNSTNTLSWDTSGGFTLAAPSTGEVSLTITAAANQDGIQVNAASGAAGIDVRAASGSFASLRLDGQISAGTFTGFELISGANSTAGMFGIFDDTAGAYRLLLDKNGAFTINSPSASAAPIALTIDSTSNNWTTFVNSTGSSGSSLGLVVEGGTTSADWVCQLDTKSDAANVGLFRGDGVVAFPSISTTASAATCWIGSSTYANQILRSTSSMRYKSDVENLDPKYVANFLAKARPVWFRSTSDADRKDWSHYGFIAEEMHEIEPRFVHYAGDLVKRVYSRERDNGKPGILSHYEFGPEKPDGVQYDRITTFLFMAVKHMYDQLVESKTIKPIG